MDDTPRALEAFSNMSAQHVARLVDINRRMQAHQRPWGEVVPSKKTEGGAMTWPYMKKHPLVDEFLEFFNDAKLPVTFDWMAWDEGRDWFALDDEAKYNKLDAATGLRLISAIIRNERFSEGAIVAGFETGQLPKIINRLTELKQSQGK